MLWIGCPLYVINRSSCLVHLDHGHIAGVSSDDESVLLCIGDIVVVGRYLALVLWVFVQVAVHEIHLVLSKRKKRVVAWKERLNGLSACFCPIRSATWFVKGILLVTQKSWNLALFKRLRGRYYPILLNVQLQTISKHIIEWAAFQCICRREIKNFKRSYLVNNKAQSRPQNKCNHVLRYGGEGTPEWLYNNAIAVFCQCHCVNGFVLTSQNGLFQVLRVHNNSGVISKALFAGSLRTEKLW